jgi:hypothetical protein
MVIKKDYLENVLPVKKDISAPSKEVRNAKIVHMELKLTRLGEKNALVVVKELRIM